MERIQKKHIFGAIIFLFFTFFLYSYVYAKDSKPTLECSFKTTCDAEETDILHLFSLENSHAELPTENNYQYHLCCKLNVEDNELSVGINPRTCEYGKFLSLYSSTNSHVAEYDYYSNKICLDVLNPENGAILCRISDSCESYETCMVSVYSEINSHAAKCDYFPKKVCCAYAMSIPINITARILDPMGRPYSGIKGTVYVCEGNVEICDEGAKWLTKMSNYTDAEGNLIINTKALVFPGKTYKIGLVSMNGYAEAIFTP